MAEILVERDSEGRWIVPPKSPGRPQGPAAAERIAAYIRPHEKEIVDKVVSLAKQGDPRSAELALKYICPPARPEDEKVSIPGFSDAPTLREKAEAVILAAAQGHCSAVAAERLLRVLDIYGKAALADEFEARLKALEGNRAPTVEAQAGSPVDDLC